MPFAGERAHLAGYVRPLEARPIDAAWLVMAADCFSLLRSLGLSLRLAG